MLFSAILAPGLILELLYIVLVGHFANKGACLQNFTRVTIISNPPGTAVNGSANTFVYPIMSNITLTCTTDPLPTSNVTYAWMTSGCTTCFPNGATGQNATTSSLTSDDAGTFTCSADGGSNSPTSSYQFTLRVSFPIPTVVVSVLNAQTVGQPLALQCEVTTVRGITSRVDIVWRDNNGRVLQISINVTAMDDDVSSTTMDDSLFYTNSYTIQQLNTTDDDRVIQCEVVINTSPSVMANDSITLDVTGVSPLQIITHPQDQLVHGGIEVTFTCEATGDPPITYQWFFNDIEIFSTASTSYTLLSNHLSYGSYHCNAISGNGQEVSSNSATLTVSPEGSIFIFGDFITSFGSAATLDCFAFGGPNNTYEWTNNQGVAISNSSRLLLPSITGSDVGDYACTVTNAAGSGNDIATVTVAPYIVLIMGENSYNQGQQLRLNCSSEGGPVLEYTWLFSGSIIPNANTSILVINNVNTTHGGNYTCSVTNDAGASSNTVTVYITP